MSEESRFEWARQRTGDAECVGFTTEREAARGTPRDASSSVGGSSDRQPRDSWRPRTRSTDADAVNRPIPSDEPAL